MTGFVTFEGTDLDHPSARHRPPGPQYGIQWNVAIHLPVWARGDYHHLILVPMCRALPVGERRGSTCFQAVFEYERETERLHRDRCRLTAH